MAIEKRHGKEPVPRKLGNYLTSRQLRTLKRIRLYGLRLEFIRRENLDQPIVFLKLRHTEKYATLSNDGVVNFNHGMDIRDGEIFGRKNLLNEIRSHSQAIH